MAEKTEIAWCDSTFNPWMGCTKVSPACDNCYAEALMDKRYGRVRWGAGEDRVRTSKSNWHQPVKWNRAAAAAGTRPMVFCASLADVFDNEVEEKWRWDLFNLIHETPHLIWLLLTKRVGNVVKMTDTMRGNRCLPQNAAIGASFANEEEYDRDRLKLHDVKESCGPLFTFGSFEPLLGPVILDKFAPDWVIVGGESKQGGVTPREMKADWARGIRNQCKRLDKPFFMKQMTDRGEIPADLMVREFPAQRIAA